jgi:hypothetical protein
MYRRKYPTSGYEIAGSKRETERERETYILILSPASLSLSLSLSVCFSLLLSLMKEWPMRGRNFLES